MCGIVGAIAFGKFDDSKMEKVRQESMIFLTTELLQETQPRGKEATGIAALFESCDYLGLKMGVSASEFITRFGGKDTDFDGFLNVWRKKTSPVRMFIGHCRKPSLNGSAPPEDNLNNHPLKIGDVIGIHNGTLTNHETIFKNLGCERDSKVDSEAIFRLVHHFTNNGDQPFTVQAIQEICKRLHGTYSCLTFNGNNPFQMAAFRDGRPMEVAIIRPLKLLLFASEQPYLKSVIFRYNKMARLYAANFIPLKKGDIDIQALENSVAYVFDNRLDITDKTNVIDLCKSDKIPYTGKIWDGKTTKTQIYNGQNYTQRTEVYTNANTRQGLPNPGEKNTSRVGMVWVKSKRSYESTEGLAGSKKLKTVEINCEDGGITNTSGNSVVNTTGKKKVGFHTSFPAEITIRETTTPVDSEILPADQAIKVKVVAVNDNNKPTGKEIATEEVIDMQSFPEVLKKAVEVAEGIERYSSDEELADDLNLADCNTMRAMPLYSLANRAKINFLKEGWYGGYVARMQEEGDKDGKQKDLSRQRDLLVRARNKAGRAQSINKVLKVVARILSKLNSDNPTDDNVNSAVSAVLTTAGKIDEQVLTSAFREGDFRDNPKLRKVVVSLKNGCQT